MKFLSGSGFFIGQRSAEGAVSIGGRCPLKGAVSPNNGLPLTQLAYVRLNSGPFSIPEWKRPDIHFLYSWKCKIHERDFSYRFEGDSVLIVEYLAGSEDFSDFPYDNYPVLFDEVRFDLQAVSEHDQKIIMELNKQDYDSDIRLREDRLSTPMHQFGGVSYMVNPAGDKNCVVCGNEMPIVASIANQNYSTKEGFVDNDFVQVIYWACVQCSVVSATNRCD